jgi:hypothetical protein
MLPQSSSLAACMARTHTMGPVQQKAHFCMLPSPLLDVWRVFK